MKADDNEAIKRALSALNSQRLQEAEQIAASILRRDPRHARALHIAGCALLMQGRADEAIEPLDRAGRGRHDPEIDTQLSMALRLAGRNDDALSRLKRTTKRNPAYAPAFLEYGVLLSLLGRHAEAIEVLQQGLAAAPMM